MLYDYYRTFLANFDIPLIIADRVWYEFIALTQIGGVLRVSSTLNFHASTPNLVIILINNNKLLWTSTTIMG